MEKSDKRLLLSVILIISTISYLFAVPININAEFSSGTLNENKDEIANMNWADLTDEFTYTSGKYVCKLTNSDVGYINRAPYSCSQEIPVNEGEVWRTTDYSITGNSNWSANARGILLSEKNQYIMDVPCEDTHSVNNTFQIPTGVKKMIINKKRTTRLYKLTDWQQVPDVTVQSGYVRNTGVIQASTYFGYIELPVQSGEIYRIADVFGGKGTGITERGIFCDASGKLVKTIKYHQISPWQWNDVIVPYSATKMLVNYTQKIQGVKNVPERLSINKAIEARKVVQDNSKFINKVWCTFGDSITLYGGWEQLVCNATGVRYYNHGYSSGSIAENGKGNGSKYPVLCYDPKIDLIIADNPDIVTIMGGVNDKAYNIRIGDYGDMSSKMGTENKSSYVGAYSYIIKKLLNWKPTLKIVIMAPSGAREDMPNAATGLLNKDYAEASKKIAEYFKLEWIDVRGVLGLSAANIKSLTRDDVHLSFRGDGFVAQEVESIFRKIEW